MKKNSVNFLEWPWELGQNPYWVNPENGYEWYVDKLVTSWCKRGNLPELDAVAFVVAERKEGKLNPISRVLVDKKTNNVIGESMLIEGISTRITMLRASKQFE